MRITKSPVLFEMSKRILLQELLFTSMDTMIKSVKLTEVVAIGKLWVFAELFNQLYG